ADAVSDDPLYGMLLDRITELATADPAADSPEGAQLTALAELCEAYEKRRGESGVGITDEANSKSRLKRIAIPRAAREADSGVEKQGSKRSKRNTRWICGSGTLKHGTRLMKCS